ncbi:MAG: glycoside hydrolase family 2 TIM barrel-domain containing protein [Bacteroidota bacterium]
MKVLVFFAKTLPFLFLFGLLKPSLVYSQEFKRIQNEQASNCKDCLLAKMGQKYTYSTIDISAALMAAGNVDRQVYFGGKMSLSLAVEDIKSSYQIKITYLSDSKDRSVKVTADGIVLQESIALPMARKLTQTYNIPASVYQDGHFSFELNALSGPNVAITQLEVLSTGSKKLIYKDLLAEALKNYVFRPERLSPKPSLVQGIKSPLLSLNGTWNITTSGKKGEIQVPGEWEMQGYQVKPTEEAAYMTHFTLPADWQDQKVVLHFDGVSAYCEVFLNDVSIGSHEGGFVQFELDASKAIKPGKNTLSVRITSHTISDELGCVSQYAAHTVGGILRTVTLMALPKVNIGTIYPEVKFDRNFQDADLTINYNMHNDNKTPKDALLKFMLFDPEGKVVALSGNLTEKISMKDGATARASLKLNISKPKKWDTEHPNLYTLVSQLISAGQVQEETRQKLGFRQIDIRGNQFFVNNLPVKLHGANRHDVTALTGRSVSPQINVSDAITFRKANCNFIRTSHYPPAEEFLNACDSLGIFVEAEAAITWIGMGANPIWREWNYLDPQYLPYFMRANLENIRGNRNHPSIILWSLANESLWSPIWKKVNEAVKQYDPGRPTIFHDQTYGDFNNQGSMADVRNIHYPGINGPEIIGQFKDRPVLFGEYYHVQTYNRLEEVTDPYIRADWGRMLPGMYQKMYEQQSCLGGAIWAGIDDVFHLPDSSIVGYGPWGALMDAWRREKPEFIAVRKSYSPFIISNLKDAKPIDGAISLKIKNRYSFANLNEGLLSYTVDGIKRLVKVNVMPGEEGELKLQIPPDATSMSIVYTDPRGFIAHEEQLIFKEESVPMETTKVPVTFKESSNLLTVNLGKQTHTFDKNTGLLPAGNMLSGLALMIIPINSDDGGAAGVAGNNYQKNIKPIQYQPQPNWKTTAVTHSTTDSVVKVNVSGSYDNIGGTLSYTFHNDGLITVDYNFKIQQGIVISPRQWGLAFTLPADFQHLSFTRKGNWSSYPADDIARTRGEIDANPVHMNSVETPLKIPAGPWSADANDLGSRDFRSTKANIYRAALRNAIGKSLTVYSDGRQSARSWIDGNKVRFLIAELNGGGSDNFFASYYTMERVLLQGGSELKGSVTLRIN